MSCASGLKMVQKFHLVIKLRKKKKKKAFNPRMSGK